MKAEQKLNRLLDDLEDGSISVLDFLDGVSGVPEFLDGLGPYAKPSSKRASAAPKGSLNRSNVVLRIKAVDPNGDNVVEGMVLPGASKLKQRMKRGHWNLKATRSDGEVFENGTKRALKAGTSVDFKTGTTFAFENSGPAPWEFAATHSHWHPDTFIYEYDGQKLTGEQLWFAIRPGPNDDEERPVYNVRSSPNGTFSLALLPPGKGTITCRYTDGENVITGLAGEAELRVGSSGSPKKLPRGASVTVASGDEFQVINHGQFPALVEVRASPPRPWEPKTSFWETSPGAFVSGDKVFFEYVVPTS